MSAARYNLLIEQGAYFERVFTVYDVDGEIRDLDGYAARMEIRRKIEDAAPMLSLTDADGILLDGPHGIVQVSILSEQTEALSAINDGWYDLELVDELGEVERLIQGRVRVSREVTR